MCEICGRNPCVKSCPNAVEKIIGYCNICGEEILESNTFYKMPDGDFVDTDCIDIKYNCNEEPILCTCCEEEIKYDEEYYLVGKKPYCKNCIEKHND